MKVLRLLPSNAASSPLIALYPLGTLHSLILISFGNLIPVPRPTTNPIPKSVPTFEIDVLPEALSLAALALPLIKVLPNKPTPGIAESAPAAAEIPTSLQLI